MPKTTTDGQVIYSVPINMNYNQSHRLTRTEINAGLKKISDKSRRKEIVPKILGLSIEYLLNLGYRIDKRHIENYEEQLAQDAENLEEELESTREMNRAIKSNYEEENDSAGGTENELVNLVTHGEDFGFVNFQPA